MPISIERAERIAKAHACDNCGEYSYKRFAIKPAPPRLREELQVEWHVQKTCGVCGLVQELGLDEDGDVVFSG